METEDKTQQATPARLQRARDEGQVALSREAVCWAGLAVASAVLLLAGPGLMRGLGGRLEAMLAMNAAPGAALHGAAMALLVAAAPVMAAVVLAGCAATLLQTRGLLHAAALAPDLARLDPRRGLSRVFGTAALAETVKALAKTAVLAWAGWRAVSDIVPAAMASGAWHPRAMLDLLARDILHVVLLVLGGQALIALADLGWVRWQFQRKLRMSTQEVKQEHREAEGDPMLKARLKQLRLQRSRRRMVARVAEATVVVTNPTHYAVALAYDRNAQAAPRIVAKGVDEVAARIRAAADRADVPLVSNPPLARALHTLPLEAEVPAEHFKAVAEIIAYVWRLKGRVAPASQVQ